MDIQVKAKSVWLLYFVLCIGIVGGILAYGVVIPLYILGYLWPSAANLADRVMCRGIRLLMLIQPWFRGDVELDLPQNGKGCLLVSNHRSHLDAFILLSRVEGIRILAKSSLFHIPFLWPMMRLSKQIPVKRGNLQSFFQAIDRVEALVSQGDTVHVFPEMTRCERGFSGTQSFSIAPFRSAMKGGFDVVPIVIEGTDEVWPKSTLGLCFRQPVRVRSLKALDPKKFSSADELMRAAREQIQSALLAGTSA